MEGPMSGSGNGSVRSYASFSAEGYQVYNDGKRVFWAFMHPHIANNAPQTANTENRRRSHEWPEFDLHPC